MRKSHFITECPLARSFHFKKPAPIYKEVLSTTPQNSTRPASFHLKKPALMYGNPFTTPIECHWPALFTSRNQHRYIRKSHSLLHRMPTDQFSPQETSTDV
ncbi:hypothetical protein AVEN_179157-1 [Araneus ventricosus]|uniref:Uncharacterized protein n=1 Tax=Araneus ventricosus TaxID=182803 RepID=A0A4Y2HMA0_ARAVE|nr:hypothetical protein AVEN_179157-1 [Araneus ventricosus]